MSDLIEWVKPSGKTLTTNNLEATVKYCKSLGYTLPKAEKKEAPKQVKKAKQNPK